MTSSSPSRCTFLLILLSVYALCNCSKLAIKKVDTPKKSNVAGEQYTPEHQISHSMLLKDEARQKRSQRDLSSSELRDFNTIITDLEDNSIAQTAMQPQEVDFEHMPPMVYYLLLEKVRQLQSNEPTYRVRTPRLGRSIDFRRFDATFGRGGNFDDDIVAAVTADDDAVGMQRQKQFVSPLIKKSVPFKPRLGKRTKQTMLCD